MSTQEFNEWCLVELFGHSKLAGIVTEATIGGCQFVRVDVPEIDGIPAFTKFYGQGAIYSMSPATEEICRAFLKNYRPVPVQKYDLSLPKPQQSDIFDEDD